MYVVDPTAKNFGQRFYRLVQGTVLAPITVGIGSAQPWTSNGLSLMLQGTMGQSYVIQASTNLVNWQTIASLVSTNWPVYFPIHGDEFRRAILPRETGTVRS